MKSTLTLLIILMWLNAFSQFNTMPTDTTPFNPFPQDTTLSDDGWKPFVIQEVKFSIGTHSVRYHVVDTSLQDFQIYDPAQQADFRYRTIGGVGLATYPVFFQPNTATGFQTGYESFDLYRLNRDKVRLYKVHQPFTELNLAVGPKREQLFQLNHAQNIKNRFRFGFQYNRVAGKGVFSRQLSNNNNFSVNANLNSKNQKYNIGALFLFNNVSAQENGGFAEAEVLYESNEVIRKDIMPVRLSTARTIMKDRDVSLRQEWVEGKKITVQLNDSISIQEMLPVFKLYHEVSYKTDLLDFNDTQPDSLFYGSFFPPEDTLIQPDTLGNFLKVQSLSNKAGIYLQFVDRYDSTNVWYKNFVLDASANYDIFWIYNYSKYERVENLNLSGILRSHPDSDKKLIYKAAAFISLIDYNSGDFKTDARLGYDFGKLGSLEATSIIQQYEPSWVYHRFFVRGTEWTKLFNKTFLYSLGGEYTLKKYRFSVAANFHNITNLLYFDTDFLPQQYNGNTQAWIFNLMKNFRWKGLGLDNRMVLQYFTGSDILRFPEYWSRHSLFYENKFFKNALLWRLGADVTFNTNYFANGYFPLTGQFYLQNEQQLQFYPVIDIWASFKIQTVRIFLKLDHVNEGLFKQPNYYNFYNYPSMQRAFRVGLSWRFYD